VVAGMTGRVALQDGVHELRDLARAGQSHTLGGTRVCGIELPDSAKGKIVLGATAFLFELVAPPPAVGQPQLPLSAKKGLFGDIDWQTAIVAAFSFVAHFLFVALVYSDWADTVVDDNIAIGAFVEAVKQLPAPAAVEKPGLETSADRATSPETEASARGDKSHGARTGTTGRGAGAPAHGSGRTANDRAAVIASELAELDLQTLGTLGPAGSATTATFDSSEVPVALLDEAARSGIGARADARAGLGLQLGSRQDAVRPGAARRDDLSDIGVTKEDPSGGAALIHSKNVAPPKGGVRLGGVQDPTGAVANAQAVVGQMRPLFRHCYEQGRLSNPEMQGSVTLAAKVGSNGEVVGVSGGGGGPLGPIVGCLKAAVQTGQFSPPHGGAGMVVIPLSFFPLEP